MTKSYLHDLMKTTRRQRQWMSFDCNIMQNCNHKIAPNRISNNTVQSIIIQTHTLEETCIECEMCHKEKQDAEERRNTIRTVYDTRKEIQLHLNKKERINK